MSISTVVRFQRSKRKLLGWSGDKAMARFVFEVKRCALKFPHEITATVLLKRSGARVMTFFVFDVKRMPTTFFSLVLPLSKQLFFNLSLIFFLIRF